MKIVLDANIFVSAFFWRGNPKEIIRRVSNGEDILFISNEIIAEVNSVFRKRKFKLTDEKVEYHIRDIKQMSTKIIVAERVTDSRCRDKTDDRYLECAVAARADYVISGDIHLRELKEYQGIRIVNPAEYLEIVNG
ncbi:MAG: putative toxin-antitoxin system toxin component, PIN family [Chitinivibrionia bacterium]|nr:putative toxin-antitoxin system toxin component, PIN family [Chitinivibrionia bacterium]